MQKFVKFAALDFFFHKFRKEIENQGEDCHGEVSAFKELNTLVAEHCSDAYNNPPSWHMTIPSTQHIHWVQFDS